MRAIRTAVAALAVCLLGAGLVRAGVYCPAEPLPWPLPSNLTHFKDLLGDLRAVAVVVKDERSPHQRYLKRVADLEAKGRSVELTVEDRVNLSAYCIRLTQYEKARQVLEAIPPDQRNFMVWSNLATAKQHLGQLDRAILDLEMALAVWPEGPVASFNPAGSLGSAQLRQCRLAERHYLKLLKLRNQEAIQAVRQPGKAPDGLDDLFGGLRFVGTNDRYQAANLAPKEIDKLPPDPLVIVGYLVLWLPGDDRLYWLLGELCNAAGLFLEADAIMDELSWARRFDNREFREHRKVLKEAKQVLAELTDDRKGPLLREMILWAAAPRGTSQAPGVAPAMIEMGWAGHFCGWDLATQGALVKEPDPPAQKRPPPWSPAWRDVAVGFVVGVVVAVLGSFQLREIRRRRQMDVPARG